MEGKYLNFCILPQDAKKKTFTWEVRNKDQNALLGVIKWHGAWRKYCFFVDGIFIFEEICMGDIASFLKKQTALYRAKKQEERQ